MKHLILNADDFAFNAAVSRGIVALAQQGRLSATSAMTLSPRWAQDAPALKELRGQIDVGLHLDWTSPFALQAGHGRGLKSAMLTAMLGGFNKAGARAVIEKQLDAFERVWQAPPSHIDGHQHVHQFKGIRDALVELMAQRYTDLPQGQKPYLRVSKGPSGQLDLKTKVIAALSSSAIKKIAIKVGITPAIGLFGVYNFTGGEAGYARRMTQWLSRAPAGCIIMCHPALGGLDAGDADDGIAAARQWEFDYLASDAFAHDLAAAQVSLHPPS
ncbi:MAG: ChbG/HpnK family deacetylase [Burkholderiaceae bacterium]|nr:ChbG/HpnK family deacetylase [Burkholderiaceae bacterium]